MKAYMSKITVGLEYEIFDINPPLIKNSQISELGKSYKDQLTKAKKAKVFQELQLGDFFPEQIKEQEYLAKIQKDGKDFLGIVFDDNNVMGKLEFVSIGSGIMPANEFLAKKNLSDIKDAIDGFGKTINNNKNNLDTTSLNFSGKREKGNFTIELFSHSIEIFKSFSPNLSLSGAVHVTHTCPIDVINQTQKFVEQMRESGGKRQSLNEIVPNKEIKTTLRTGNSPNPKTPVEFLIDITNNTNFSPEQKKYVQSYKNNEALYPMSNLVQYLKNDIEIYKNVMTEISIFINNNSSINLDPAIKKLDNTITQITELIKNKPNNHACFHSFEEKLQPLIGNNFLVEHRGKSQTITKLCQDYFRSDMLYDKSKYENIIKSFALIDVTTKTKWTEVKPRYIEQNNKQIISTNTSQNKILFTDKIKENIKDLEKSPWQK